MRNLRFERLTIASNSTREGRVVEFGPGKNVIFSGSENSTGKSTLLKTLLWTMGAEPAVMVKAWLDTQPRCLVEFEIEAVPYAVLRRGKVFTVFRDREVLFSSRSVTNDVGPGLAKIFDFGLVLPDKKSESKTPPPAYYFVPFYIDQDRGWSELHVSLARLGQFSRWQDPVVEYHGGVRSNRWFTINAELAKQQERRKDPAQERRALRGVLRDIERLLETVPVELDLGAFKEEIRALSKAVERLYSEQLDYRARMARALESEKILEAQIRILDRAAKEIDADFEFASQDAHDHVDCPTCGQNYSNDFAHRFSIAEDAERCLDLQSELRLDLREARVVRNDLKARLRSVSAAIAEVQGVLDVKLGELTLRDIARIQGKQELRNVVGQKLADVERRLEEVDGAIGRLTDEREAEKKAAAKRKKAIQAEFGDRVAHYATRLQIGEFAESVPKKLRFKIDVAGSERPRAILSYYLAFYEIARSHGPCVLPPLIVDTPRQQDLTDENFERVLRTFVDEFPSDSQLIVATVQGSSELGAEAHRIPMLEKRSAIRTDQYEEAMTFLRPFIQRADNRS